MISIKSLQIGHEGVRLFGFLFALAGLQRHAPVRTILEEDAAVDLSLVDPGFLVPAVDDVVGAGGLLQDADLVLTLTGVVVRQGLGDGLERLVARRVVDLQGASRGKKSALVPVPDGQE